MSDTTPHFIAIDPGKSGGIAWTVDGGPVQACRMPDTVHDLYALLLGIRGDQTLDPATAYIEDIPRHQGLMSASSLYVLARNFGQAEGVLAAHGQPLVHVSPQAWQKAHGLGKREKTGNAGRDRTAWKNKLKARAQAIFPHLTVTLDTADALLILWAAMQRRI
jgi:hypothetical protein